jgi:hypothetical protein
MKNRFDTRRNAIGWMFIRAVEALDSGRQAHNKLAVFTVAVVFGAMIYSDDNGDIL